MTDFLAKLHAAPSARAFNSLLERAGSTWWLQRSGTGWQQMDGSLVVGFPNSFEDARGMIIDHVRSAIQYGTWRPADLPKPGRKPLADGDGKTARVQLKLTQAEKARWLREADEAGLTLQAWVERRCAPAPT